MSDSPIGLIGVGLLGTALAERTLAGGRRVLGFDLDPAACERLVRLGGEATGSVGEVARACPCIVLVLPDSQVVREVVGQMAGDLRPGHLLIDATTGDPDDAVQLARELAARGVDYVDATVAGSSEQTRQGAASVLIGASPGALARAEPVLAAWSPRRHHVGPAGSGARMKLIVNLVLGLNRAVLAEGLSLARACGIDAAAALGILQSTPAASAIMAAKGPKMVAGDYTPQARLAQHWKDVQLIRRLAERVNAPVPLSAVHDELLRRAVELGYGEADNSAVIEAFERRRELRDEA